MKSIFSVQSTKEIDKLTVEKIGMPSLVLMENAAEGILNQVIHKGESYIIFCGIGNNGGDGLALARKLLYHNKKVKVFILGNISRCSDDFKINYNILKNITDDIEFISDKTIDSLDKEIKSVDVVIDAIFGIGLSRKIDGLIYKVISIINKNSDYIVSIDSPSGLDCESGEVLGISVIANETYSIEMYKKGFFLTNAQKYIGDIKIIKIGIPDKIKDKYDDKIYLLDRDDYKKILPTRLVVGHKGNYGKVLILAGSKNFTGAGYIVTEAAIRSGSGLVTLLVEDNIQSIFQNKFIEAMTLPYSDTDKILNMLKSIDVLICGPGLGVSNVSKDILTMCITKSKCNLLLDADALNIISKDSSLIKYLKNRAILTPHSGEMAKLTNKKIDEIERNRIEESIRYARDNNVVIVLKGHNTIITDGNKTFINRTGSSKMASGGMGDCLSGIIGSLMGQGLLNIDSANLGVYLHGLCGDKIGEEQYSVSARDIIEIIPKVMEELRKN